MAESTSHTKNGSPRVSWRRLIARRRTIPAERSRRLRARLIAQLDGVELDLDRFGAVAGRSLYVMQGPNQGGWVPASIEIETGLDRSLNVRTVEPRRPLERRPIVAVGVLRGAVWCCDDRKPSKEKHDGKRRILFITWFLHFSFLIGMSIIFVLVLVLRLG